MTKGIKTVINGFPRIGEHRELKKALEAFWSGKADASSLQHTASTLRHLHWGYQRDAGVDLVSCGDFSLYDTVLDTAVMFGVIPDRYSGVEPGLSRYFAMARGTDSLPAMEMTKWFNTNYHYIVPEFESDTRFELNPEKLMSEWQEARTAGHDVKLQVLGPLSFLRLGKISSGTDPLDLIDRILPAYEDLLTLVAATDSSVVVQFDEPVLVRDPDSRLLSALRDTYHRLSRKVPALRLVVTTFFEHSAEATEVLVDIPVWGLGLDFVHGSGNYASLQKIAKSDKTLIAGVIDGRNIWKNDYMETLRALNRILAHIPRGRLILSPGSSLLHVPYSLESETGLDTEIRSWLSFAREKLTELVNLSRLLDAGFEPDKEEGGLKDSSLLAVFESNRRDLKSRRGSVRVKNQTVRDRVAGLGRTERADPYSVRIGAQKSSLGYPRLATTTIGSYPQTPELRILRKSFKEGSIDETAYRQGIEDSIAECIRFQESVGLDVLVHGEPERNDMVEYFGEMLEGFVFTSNGWVQSYGSRCVKPPVIYGDVRRPQAMTVGTIAYAQSLTEKIVKGMLTGPVTMLNWSFVRDDLPRAAVSDQIAVALSDEVADLQASGIRIIQVDEAAFKEGYPLRASDIPAYESWAVRGFKITVSPARRETQIHTHMCYSDFNDCISTIEAMDADVISIETARSGNELLKVFKRVGYRQEIGPGVYDIHSPRIPSVEELQAQIKTLLEVIPADRLWINPDCGLKTRKWEEVRPSLHNMVEAVSRIRAELSS